MHHSKFALLFYDRGVRVMITTANFLQDHWEDKADVRKSMHGVMPKVCSSWLF